MRPDQVTNPGPLAHESEALPTALPTEVETIVLAPYVIVRSIQLNLELVAGKCRT